MSGFDENLREKQRFINEVVEGIDFDVHSLLKVPAEYALLTGGKRLRPLICMLCAEVVGGDYRDTREAFLALELIHNGTLVHDDIIDDDLLRRGRPSVHVKFNGKLAVLTGDILLSLGLKYATRTGSIDIVSWLSDTAMKMVQGVTLQTYYRRRITSTSKYLNMAYLKSGSLFEAAAALGGLVGCGSGMFAKSLADFGRNFGIAYQIRDDICGVFYDDEMSMSRSDMLNGDLTLPFIYALDSESISGRDRDALMDMFLGRSEEVDEEEVKRIYEDTGALERSIEEMKCYAKAGRESLNHFERSESRDCIYYILDLYYEKFSPLMRLEIGI